jgi:hypothetical protein
MYVAVVDAPFVSVSSSMGTNLMAGQPVVFTATVSGINLLSTVKYQWYVNGLSVPGATASSYSTSALADESVVSCEVTASGYCGVASAVGSIAVNVRSITGLYDNQSGGIVNVWPNPSKGIIHITGNFKTMTSHPVPVVITDHLGRQVYNTTSDIVNGFFSSEFSLPKELPDGIYVVSISINGAWYHEQVALIR